MTQLLQNAAYGTALILAAAALRRVLKDRLLPEARLCLWAVCLFRLLTPAAPASALSLWGLFSKPAPAPIQTPQLYNIPAPVFNAPAPQPSAPEFSWEMALGLVWLAVGAVLAVRYVLSWRRTRRAVASAILLERDDPRYLPLPRCARLREGPMEGAPLTFGAVRPTVVLSPGLGGEELACVLAHEGVHARRRDNLWHYAMALALAVHWWNPAVWLMARLLRRDIELSCDRAALKRLGADKRAQYAQALVTLATQGADPAFCQTFGRKAAEERILSIMKFKRTSIIGAIFSLTLVLAVTVAFASEPKEPQPEYDSVKTGSVGQRDYVVAIPDIDATKELQSDFPEVDPDNVDLSMMKEMLDKKVADGQITQAEADQRLADTEDLLEQARRGEVKLFMTDDGCFYGSGVSRMYYRDENGDLIPMDPSRTTSSYVLDGYVVETPIFEMDGSSVSADGGIIGKRFGDYDMVVDGSHVSGSLILISGGTYELCKDKDCGVSYGHCHIDGKVVRVYQEDPGLLCAHPDCTNEEPHQHDGVQYAGKAPEAYVILEPEMELVPSNSPEPTPVLPDLHSNLIPAMGTNGEEGYIHSGDMPLGQYERLHGPITSPDQAMKYMEWLETQPDTWLIPLYDIEGNVIGEFSVGTGNSPAASCPSDPSCPVCAVEGCAIQGRHDHDGVTYCGGAGHRGNTCDGSCIYCTQQATADAHHQNRYGNGHH